MVKNCLWPGLFFLLLCLRKNNMYILGKCCNVEYVLFLHCLVRQNSCIPAHVGKKENLQLSAPVLNIKNYLKQLKFSEKEFSRIIYRSWGRIKKWHHWRFLMKKGDCREGKHFDSYLCQISHFWEVVFKEYFRDLRPKYSKFEILNP